MLRFALAIILCACCLGSAGCRTLSPLPTEPVAPAVPGGNPLFVAIADRELVWSQVVDEIDNYFEIEREDRVRLAGNVVTEGTITTFPRVGSNVLEPWHGDSSPGYEKLLSTLQTVYRRARVRVIPTNGGYLIDVAVFKQMEDRIAQQPLSTRPEALSHNDSLVRIDARSDDETLFEDLPPGVAGWVPLGRDTELEQRILANLSGRLQGL